MESMRDDDDEDEAGAYSFTNKENKNHMTSYLLSFLFYSIDLIG